jgi:hypothetical protein
MSSREAGRTGSVAHACNINIQEAGGLPGLYSETLYLKKEDRIGNRNKFTSVPRKEPVFVNEPKQAPFWESPMEALQQGQPRMKTHILTSFR